MIYNSFIVDFGSPVENLQQLRQIKNTNQVSLICHYSSLKISTGFLDAAYKDWTNTVIIVIINELTLVIRKIDKSISIR